MLILYPCWYLLTPQPSNFIREMENAMSDCVIVTLWSLPVPNITLN
jgi:hypothetical protein